MVSVAETIRLTDVRSFLYALARHRLTENFDHVSISLSGATAQTADDELFSRAR